MITDQIAKSRRLEIKMTNALAVFESALSDYAGINEEARHKLVRTMLNQLKMTMRWMVSAQPSDDDEEL